MFGNKLRAVITTNMLWRAVFGEQICQDMEQIRSPDSAGHMTCQCLVRKLIDDVERSKLAPIARLISDEVIAPNMVLAFSTQPYD